MKSLRLPKAGDRPDNALSLTISAELKSALLASARVCGVNAADLVRLSLRATLPVIDVLAQSRAMLITELLTPETRKLRKRHLGLDDDDEGSRKNG